MHLFQRKLLFLLLNTMSGQKVTKADKNDDSDNYANRIKGFLSRILSPLGTLIAVIGLVESVINKPGIFAIGLLLISIVILLHVYFGKKSRTSVITGEQRREPIYPNWARFLASMSLVAILLVTVIGIGICLYARFLPTDKVIVLVAEFDGPEPKKYRVTENIIRRLREATAKYDDVTIEALHEVITEQQGSRVALEKGKLKKASVVLWGWYAATAVEAEITPYFEFLRKPDDVELGINRQPFSAPINELETFTMQTQLSIGASSIVLVTAGLVRYERGDYKAAMSLFSDALSDQNILHKSWIAQIYYFRANVHFDIGDYDRAISDNTMASDLDPDLASAYFNRANAYAIKKLYKEAIADYDQAIKKRPNHANSHYGRGFAYYCLGNHNEAMRSFDTSASIDSNNVGVFVGRGQIYHDKGEYDRAIEEYDRSIRLTPAWAQLYNSRGNVYRANGEYSRAISDFDHAIRLTPSYAKAYFNRGLTYYEIKDFDHAISDFDSTIKLDPSLVHAYHNLGTAFAQKGEFQKAVLYYTEAIRRDPSVADTYKCRAIAYSQMGQKTLAITDFQKVLEISKDQEMRRTAELELQILGVDISNIE